MLDSERQRMSRAARAGRPDQTGAAGLPRLVHNWGLDLVLLDAGLYRLERQPSGGSIGAIVGPGIEGNRRAWGSLTNSIDDDFE
jgi:hypothetical protein